MNYYRILASKAHLKPNAGREQGCMVARRRKTAPFEAAVALYHKLGFKEIEPYYRNPLDDVIYFGIDL